MKKVDLIIIISILLLGVILFIINYDKIFLDTSNSLIQVTYKGQEVANIDYQESINYTIAFKSETTKQVKVTIINNVNHEEIIKYLDDNSLFLIENELSVTYESIHMVNANCPNKNCLEMNMDSDSTFPIICTNGVVVKFIPKEIGIVIV